MSLTLKEVRVPTPLVRARKILAALSASGDINEYSAHNAEISVDDAIAFVAPAASQILIPADTAMGLADATVIGSTIRIQMLRSDAASDVVVTPDTPNGFATLTFDAEDEYAVLIWSSISGWQVRVASAGVVA